MAKRKRDKRKRKKFPSPKEMWEMMRMKHKIESIIPDKQKQTYISSLINEFDEKIALMEKLGVDYLVGV